MKKAQLYYLISRERRRIVNAMQYRYITRLRPRRKIQYGEYIQLLNELYAMPADTARLLTAMVGESITAALNEGYSVEVPHLGTFALHASARATEHRQEAGRQAINYIRVNFTPCGEMAAQFRAEDCILVESPVSVREGVRDAADRQAEAERKRDNAQ